MMKTLRRVKAEVRKAAAAANCEPANGTEPTAAPAAPHRHRVACIQRLA